MRLAASVATLTSVAFIITPHVGASLTKAPDGPLYWNLTRCSTQLGLSPPTSGVQKGIGNLQDQSETPISNGVAGGCQEIWKAPAESPQDARMYICGQDNSHLTGGNKPNRGDAADAANAIVSNCTLNLGGQNLTGGVMNVLKPDEKTMQPPEKWKRFYITLHIASNT